MFDRAFAQMVKDLVAGDPTRAGDRRDGLETIDAEVAHAPETNLALLDEPLERGDGVGEGMATGSFHSTALKLTERFTMADADNIDYEATIEDPNVFTRPWKLAFGVWKRAPAGYENFEFACHEGNRSMVLTEVLFKKP